MKDSKIPLSSLMSERLLTYLYTQSHKTDKEIAEFFNVDRTTVSKFRNEYGVDTRISTGSLGEHKAFKKLKAEGFRVRDMNKKNKLSEYDLKVDGFLRVEVKTAKYKRKDKRFCFSLSEQAKLNCVESRNRITLPNGRTRKLFSRTCDFIIFVCVADNEDIYYIVPSDFIKDEVGFINLRVNDPRFEQFKNNWTLLRKGLTHELANTSKSN